MFVRIKTDSSLRPNTLRDLGMAGHSNALVNLSEFSYRKGSEIYGEKEPAEYVYQVKSGAVRSYKLLSDGRTLFFVSHNERDLRRFCTRGLYLDKHRLAMDAPIDEVLARYNADYPAGG